MVIGARFDTDVSTAACRLAFYGRIAALLDPADAAALARLRVAKLKAKHGVIERVSRDGRTAICRGMFKKETDLSAFRGMKVQCRFCTVRLAATHVLINVPCIWTAAGRRWPDPGMELSACSSPSAAMLPRGCSVCAARIGIAAANAMVAAADTRPELRR